MRKEIRYLISEASEDNNSAKEAAKNVYKILKAHLTPVIKSAKELAPAVGELVADKAAKKIADIVDPKNAEKYAAQLSKKALEKGANALNKTAKKTLAILSGNYASKLRKTVNSVFMLASDPTFPSNTSRAQIANVNRILADVNSEKISNRQALKDLKIIEKYLKNKATERTLLLYQGPRYF